uniref:Putative secreted protein n=1 Tax=Ixodes ricinus TaxID=34613 RepID=A0A090X9K3_IXORI
MKVFALTLRLFATVIGVPLVVETRPIDEYWQRSTQVGSFQSAWEAIGQRGVYYLWFATEDLTYDCVTIEVTEAFSDKKTIHYKFRGYNESLKKTKEFEGVSVVTDDIRGQGTTLDNSVKEKNERWQSQIVYTEKDSKCFVLYLPKTNVYQLWLNKKETRPIPRGCEFAYSLVTYGLNTHVCSYKSICKHVVEDTGNSQASLQWASL